MVVRLTGKSTDTTSAIKPRVAVIAGSHGNEAVTTEIAIALMSYLLRKYKSDVVISQVCAPVISCVIKCMVA